MTAGSHAIKAEVATRSKLRRRHSLSDMTSDAVLVLLLLGFVAPIVWMIILAFQSDRAIISMFWEIDLTLDNVASILSPAEPFRAQLVNSIIVVTGTVVLCGAASTLAAYSLSKLRLSGWLNAADNVSCAVVPLLPPMALVPGFYVTLIQTGLLGSLTGLVILNTILNLPFATLLMKIGFDDIPPALQEAASIDGASEARTFWMIMLPLSMPSLITSSLFTAIMTWNEFLMGLTMTSGGTTSPLSVGIASLVQPYEVRWGQLAAAGSRAVVPIMIASVVASKRIIAGMTRGAVK
ncbi:carbohydrate ABC transporter permease [Sinorhizobium medicae]|uniref:carbohydrate ABC transporter permease n=1 Tax=Sinorhizobium medicae TaxID=110321 RepID=UPI0009DAD657|nr:carbohydrate ABC transporter permease [Sinorhizobium medicae]